MVVIRSFLPPISVLCSAMDVKVHECLYLYDVDYIQIASQFVIFSLICY